MVCMFKHMNAIFKKKKNLKVAAQATEENRIKKSN